MPWYCGMPPILSVWMGLVGVGEAAAGGCREAGARKNRSGRVATERA